MNPMLKPCLLTVLLSMVTLSSFAQTGQGGTTQSHFRATPIGGLVVVDQEYEYDHDEFLIAVQKYCNTFENGQMWELEPSKSENPDSFSRFLNVISKVREDRSGVNHYIYYFPENAEKPEDLVLMAAIKVNYILDSDSIYRMVEHTNFEYAENVDGGRLAQRIKATFRFRNDGHLAIRYLRQDSQKKWHVISVGVYKVLNQPFIASGNVPFIPPKPMPERFNEARAGETYFVFKSLGKAHALYGTSQTRTRGVLWSQAISSEPEQIPVGDIWTFQ